MANIFDCFLYNNEKELLELRLTLLSEFVDSFVIGWSPYTFTGLLKTEPFPYDMPIVEQLGGRIEVVEIDNLTGKNAWARETASRNALSTALVKLSPKDIVLISDVDEIPKPSCLVELATRESLIEPVVLVQDYYNFKFNFRLTHGMRVNWAGPVALEYGEISSLQELRSRRWELMDNKKQSIFNAGWHFSYLTHGRSVREKLQHFSHQEASVQDRASADINELIRHRKGFSDNVHAGSVWAVQKLSGIECKELEALVSGYPTLLADCHPDSPEVIHQATISSIRRLYSDERSKVLQACSFREILSEVKRRLTHKVRDALRN